MTAPAHFTRDSADVQAIRLDGSLAAFMAAELWLRNHGVRTAFIVNEDGPTLTIYGPGSRTVARLGDWLTLDERTGAFSVEADDDGKPIGHRERGAL